MDMDFTNPEYEIDPLVDSFKSIDAILLTSKPTNMAIWSESIQEAMRRFDVYPSSYAEGWVLHRYLRKGGKWETISEEKKQFSSFLNRDSVLNQMSPMKSVVTDKDNILMIEKYIIPGLLRNGIDAVDIRSLAKKFNGVAKETRETTEFMFNSSVDADAFLNTITKPGVSESNWRIDNGSTTTGNSNKKYAICISQENIATRI